MLHYPFKHLTYFTVLALNFKMSAIPHRMFHQKCRSEFYPRTFKAIKRFPVPEDKVEWTVNFEEYKPEYYTSEHIQGQIWADPEIGQNFHPKWNEIDGNVNRKSHEGNYEIIEGKPQNLMGRTGVIGRGVLGRWGPNHAADPIVTRWKRCAGHKVIIADKPVLQFVAILRKDSMEWAIPGGMVDAGEQVTSTLKREFMEEALNYLESSNDDKLTSEKLVNDFFSNGEEIYKGYVDDPRNTDNAWMETVAMNFHDDSGKSVGSFPLNAGDDACGVKWMDVTQTQKLYASHSAMIAEVAKRRQSFW